MSKLDNISRLALDPAPPEKELIVSSYGSGGIGLASTGPRGGWTYISIPKESRRRLARFLLEGLNDGLPYYCRACGRAEDDCSAEPCAKVIADREA